MTKEPFLLLRHGCWTEFVTDQTDQTSSFKYEKHDQDILQMPIENAVLN